MLKVKKIYDDAKLPERSHDLDLGYDLYSAEQHVLNPREIEIIGTGIKIQFPDGWGGFIKDRSSYATRRDLETSAGVIDGGYRDEIKIAVRNHGDRRFRVRRGKRIAQLVPIPVTHWDVEEVDELGSSERGEQGFGSTGDN